MKKAEKILEKHLVDYDTISYTDEDYKLKQCYLNAINEALSINVVSQCEALDPTNKQEPLLINVKKEVFVELYDFAFKLALKTKKVEELLEIDRRLHCG